MRISGERVGGRFTPPGSQTKRRITTLIILDAFTFVFRELLRAYAIPPGRKLPLCWKHGLSAACSMHCFFCYIIYSIVVSSVPLSGNRAYKLLRDYLRLLQLSTF